MTVFVSVGGSIISTVEGISISWIEEFAKEIKDAVEEGNSFYLVVGGGKICGQYAKAAQELGLGNDFADSVAIDVTKINARLLGEKLKGLKNVKIDHGEKPGQTTDMVLIDRAIKWEEKEVVNLTIVDGVYDKDPKEFKDAKLIRELTASDYLKMFKEQAIHSPKIKAPFEVRAVKKASENGIDVYVINGLNPHEQFHQFLQGRKDIGTRIVSRGQ